MKKWREEEKLNPEQMRDRADTWVREARVALKLPPEPQNAKLEPRPVIPKNFPPRRQRAVKQARRKPGRPPAAKPATHGPPRPPVPSKLPDTDVLVRLFLDEDKTIYEIADIYNASGELVRLHLKKAGVTGALKKERKKEALLARIRELFGQGLRIREISQVLGYTDGHIYTLAKEAGIETGSRPFICYKCDEAPYAMGLCKRCYELARKGLVSPEDAARAAQRAKLAKKPGPKKGPKPETLETVRKIRQLREQGKKWREIGLALDLTIGNCWYLLNYYGDRLDQR